MNIGVILLLPSEVLVSICLFIGPLAGVEFVEGGGTALLGTGCGGQGCEGGAGGFKLRSSGASMTIQPPWTSGLPYIRS